MKDIYCYQNSNVLKNKLGIKTKELLELAEADYVAYRIKEVALNPLKGDYDYRHYLSMHHWFFQDIYEWAGYQRNVDIIKEEPVLGGLSVEYSSVISIAKDTNLALDYLRNQEWKLMDISEISVVFSEALSRLWRVHCFREGNTRTTVTFCCQFADEFIKPIDRRLLEENSIFVRNALVAHNAYFSDGKDYSDKSHLQRIIKDAFT